MSSTEHSIVEEETWISFHGNMKMMHQYPPARLPDDFGALVTETTGMWHDRLAPSLPFLADAGLGTDLLTSPHPGRPLPLSLLSLPTPFSLHSYPLNRTCSL